MMTHAEPKRPRSNKKGANANRNGLGFRYIAYVIL